MISLKRTTICKRKFLSFRNLERILLRLFILKASLRLKMNSKGGVVELRRTWYQLILQERIKEVQILLKIQVNRLLKHFLIKFQVFNCFHSINTNLFYRKKNLKFLKSPFIKIQVHMSSKQTHTLKKNWTNIASKFFQIQSKSSSPLLNS